MSLPPERRQVVVWGAYARATAWQGTSAGTLHSAARQRGLYSTACSRIGSASSNTALKEAVAAAEGLGDGDGDGDAAGAVGAVALSAAVAGVSASSVVVLPAAGAVVLKPGQLAMY